MLIELNVTYYMWTLKTKLLENHLHNCNIIFASVRKLCYKLKRPIKMQYKIFILEINLTIMTVYHLRMFKNKKSNKNSQISKHDLLNVR